MGSFEDFAVSFLIPLGYLLIGICLLTIIGFAIKSSVTNYKKSKKTVLGIIAVAILFLLGYILGDGSGSYLETHEVTANQEKLIEAGIYSTYIAAFLITIGIVITEIKTFTSK